MSQSNDLVFPLIFENLSRKAQFAETPRKLFRDIQEALESESVAEPKLKKEFEKAIEVGIDMGILSIKNDKLQMPHLEKNRIAALEPGNSRIRKSRTSSRSSDSSGRDEDVAQEQVRNRRRNRRSRRSMSRSRSRRGNRSRRASRRRSATRRR